MVLFGQGWAPCWRFFSLLLVNKYRQSIFNNLKAGGQQIKFIFLLGQALAGISFLLINYAIALGSVTLTNALQSLQYVFLFLLIIFLSKKYPLIIHEKFNTKIIFQKLIAIIFIGLGLFFISI